MSDWDIVWCVIATPVVLLVAGIALCNCCFVVRVVARGDASSPSPIPAYGTILAVVLALIGASGAHAGRWYRRKAPNQENGAVFRSPTRRHFVMTTASKTCLVGDDVFTVGQFLSVAECNDLIASSESVGFEPATVNTVGGHQMLPDWRNNTRVMVDDHDRAAWLWHRARPFVPNTIDGWHAIGVNERLRFYRYDPGQQFDWHTDGYYRRENNDRSFLTFMVYLNGGFAGGETTFTDDRTTPRFRDFAVTPDAGLALFFTHMLLHKGEPVTDGRKYVLRTDVMYSRSPT